MSKASSPGARAMSADGMAEGGMRENELQNSSAAPLPSGKGRGAGVFGGMLMRGESPLPVGPGHYARRRRRRNASIPVMQAVRATLGSGTASAKVVVTRRLSQLTLAPPAEARRTAVDQFVPV